MEANVSDSELIGLEGSYEHLDVPLEDLEQGASIVVFESAEAAEAEAEAADVAMGVGDTTVAGNTIWGVDLSVSEPDDAEALRRVRSGELAALERYGCSLSGRAQDRSAS